MVRILRLLAICAGLSSISVSASAEVRPYNPGEWRLPSAAEISAAWPPGAKVDDYTAWVDLECSLDGKGVPIDCAVVGEEVPGKGFGTAALALVTKYRFKSPSKAPVRAAIPVNFVEPGFVRANWLKRPSPDDIMGVWPNEALKRGMGGRAILGCTVNRQGALIDCRAESEEPAGMNFGAAAVALTPQMLMKPATFNGQPVVSKVRVPVNFEGLSGSDAVETGSRVRPAFDPFFSDRIIEANLAWNEAPTYAEVATAYPAEARAKAVGGRVVLDCAFDKEGRLRNCAIVQEEPKGLGFASAARGLARTFKAPTRFADGSSIAGVHVQLPITFTTEMLSAAPPTMGKPNWAALPGGDQMADQFPAAARKAGLKTGRAFLICTVQAGGALACTVEKEEPAGHGFGAAALNLAPYFRMETWTREGLPTVGQRLRAPIRFIDEEPAPAKEG